MILLGSLLPWNDPRAEFLEHDAAAIHVTANEQWVQS
jgi:hypothetical protein